MIFFVGSKIISIFATQFGESRLSGNLVGSYNGQYSGFSFPQ